MATALYRQRSGEVLKISLTNQPFNQVDATYFGVLHEVGTPDGAEYVDAEGNYRMVGKAKIADVPQNRVVNATQQQIDGFAAAEETDERLMDAARASSLAEIDPVFARVFKGFLRIIIAEVFQDTNAKVNTLITQWNQHKADIASATTLAALKTSTAALPTVQPNLRTSVTLAQAIAALKNNIAGPL